MMICNLEEGGQVSSSVVIYTTKKCFFFQNCSRKVYSNILLYFSKNCVVSKGVYRLLFHFAYSCVRIVIVTLS